MPDFPTRGAPVVPNAARIRGRLLRMAPEPDGRGSVWDVAVDEALDVDGLPNLAQPYVGRTIQLFVHQALQHDLAEQARVEARVAYRGDERGGRFALIEDDVRKL